MSSEFHVSRRNTLGILIGSFLAGAGSVLAPAAHSASPLPSGKNGSLDPYDADDFAVISRKLLYRGDDGLCFAWLKATKYALVKSSLTPLHSMESGALFRIQTTTDGYDVTTLERTFYTAVGTDELLDEWRNPLTGETLILKRGPVGPTTQKYRRDGSLVLPKAYLGLDFEATSSTRLANIHGDDIWLLVDSDAKVFRNGPDKPPFHVTEMRTTQARLSDAIEPKNNLVETSLSLHEVNSWPETMRMGDIDGSVIIRGFGRKIFDFNKMPDSWLTKLRRINPDIAADPVAALDKTAARFEQ